MRKISSPDQLTDYLHVTSLGMWVILAAAIVLLVGMLIWSSVGTLKTTEKASVLVKDHTAEISISRADSLKEGLTVTIVNEDYTISDIKTDDLGRTTAFVQTELPDGLYEGVVTLGTTKPIDFLLGRGEDQYE